MSDSEANDWKKRLPRCFGILDDKFALHPFDLERAKNMIALAFEAGASQDDICDAITEYLTSKGRPQSHINEQIEVAQGLFW